MTTRFGEVHGRATRSIVVLVFISLLSLPLSAGSAGAARLGSTPPASSRTPGSLLIYPVHRSGPNWFTVVCVTNTNTEPKTPQSFGGSTIAHFEYFNVTPNPANALQPTSCLEFDRREFLTPADSLCVLTSCHNAAGPGGQEGYLVVTAEDPASFQTRWSHNWLIGSELVISASGTVYSINAIPFESPVAPRQPTEMNGNRKPDFDGVEYESVPDRLILDSFFGMAGMRLALVSLDGSARDLNTLMISIWNDNEFPLSATQAFNCWFDAPLTTIAPAFNESFLAGLPNDPSELDLNCDGHGDVETGWAVFDSVDLSGPLGNPISDDGALVGAITAGILPGGRLLWEDPNPQVAPIPAITEDFANNAQLDPSVSSSKNWVGGAKPGLLGWDGLHGEFDPQIGNQVSPGVFEFSTDNQLFPASSTLSGMPIVVTDGVFRFSKLEVPSGVTIRFVGSNPARIHVRGILNVEGTIESNGETLPEPIGGVTTGQAGGLGGASGGAGGMGGDRSNGTNSTQWDGQAGEPVQVPPTHANAGNVAGTGGAGSIHFPEQNTTAACAPSTCVEAGLRGFFSIQVAAGGGGGGYLAAGLPGVAVQTPDEFGVNQPQYLGPPAAAGIAFGIVPLPAGVSVFDHFLVGGSGGGGAGSHPYNSPAIPPQSTQWRSGGGGAGGGGALGFRIGGSVAVGAAGAIECKGGSTQASSSNGFAVPGGAGSGGSILVQAAEVPLQTGVLDVSGGNGGSVLGGFIAMQSDGGNGSPGHFRVEAPGSPPANPATWTGVTNPPATASNVATLQEQDPVTGIQSGWYASGTTSSRVWQRYELAAAVNGTSVIFSDDPLVGTPAAPGQAVQFYVQGALIEPATGQPQPGTETPWLRTVGPFAVPSLSQNAANGIRFLVLFDRSVASQIVVSKVDVIFQ